MKPVRFVTELFYFPYPDFWLHFHHCLIISISVVTLKTSNNMEQVTLNFSASSVLRDDFYMYLGTELSHNIQPYAFFSQQELKEYSWLWSLLSWLALLSVNAIKMVAGNCSLWRQTELHSYVSSFNIAGNLIGSYLNFCGIWLCSPRNP